MNRRTNIEKKTGEKLDNGVVVVEGRANRGERRILKTYRSR